MSNKLTWGSKYRPTTLDGYVFQDEQQQKCIEGWIKDGIFPHVLFHGTPGVGKTTLANILFNVLNVDEYDILKIKASVVNSVENIRTVVSNFADYMPHGNFRVVFFDEADGLSKPAQYALRNVMDDYEENCRFILTANAFNKIIEPLHSRCQVHKIGKLDINEFTARAATVLLNEDIEFDIDLLDIYVKATYPDLRKCINNLQKNSIDGKLQLLMEVDGSSNAKIKAVDLFMKRDINEARKVLCGNIPTEEIEDMYKWCYQNIELFGNTPEKQDTAILIIKQGLLDHSIIADPEINLSATLIRLARNYNS